MELYEIILVAVVVFGVGFVAYRFGRVAGENGALKQLKDEYHEGWTTAKRFYHDEPREEKEREAEVMAQVNAENAEASKRQRIEELLIAYGVDRVSQLPKNVREVEGLEDRFDPADIEHSEVYY